MLEGRVHEGGDLLLLVGQAFGPGEVPELCEQPLLLVTVEQLGRYKLTFDFLVGGREEFRLLLDRFHDLLGGGGLI